MLALNAALRTLVPSVAPPFAAGSSALVGREVKVLGAPRRQAAHPGLDPIDSKAVPDEVQPLVGALNGLMARLGEALGQQRQFIADAAHELRTPLTALRLQLQLAERAKDDAARAQAHTMLREGIIRATHVVEQLLALARADPEVANLARSRVDLAEIARSVAEAQRPAAQAKGLALVVSADRPVETNADRASLRAEMENP